MPSEILVNVRPNETRVAYIDGGVLTDLKMERKTSPTLVGSVHRGKVLRVLPGMQAAFVDIGLDRAAFLYVGDVRENIESESADPDDLEVPSAPKRNDLSEDFDSSLGSPEPRTPIQELISEGQSLLVQVAKDPIGSKGARITTHVSLPGRNIVLLPTLKHLGISRRIEDPNERERLRQAIEKIGPRGGVIVRTAGEGASEASLRGDVEYLHRLWQDIEKNYENQTEPGLVHSELDVELRALRDLLNEDVERVVTDNKVSFEKIKAFIGQFMPHFGSKVSLYTDARPLFDLYEVDLEVSRSMERKIWLKSGGYIVIDEAEALVVIDVNTGRYVGKKDFEETVLKTNLEAVREIAHQLRIRNCGGIIIIDFIDMEKEVHREKLLQTLREELQKDRARTSVASMSNLGLVEMTRKRIRPSLIKALCEPCPYCEGRGFIKQKATIAHEIFRDIERERQRGASPQASILVHCHADVADFIYEEEPEMLEDVEHRIGCHVAFKLEPGFHREQYEIIDNQYCAVAVKDPSSK